MTSLAEAPPKTNLLPSELVQERAEFERQPESVIKLLLDRVQRGYRRGIDDDGHKVGLAFDAGGMAGVVSGAMAQELEPTGILNVVDGFYGLSAGGFNALYIAAGQIQEGIGIYTDVFPDNGFIDMPKVVPPQKPTMSLDVLRDTVYKTRKLNVKKIVEEKIPVILGATDLSDPLKRPVIFRSTDLRPEEADKLIEQAIAGSHIPVVAGEPVALENGKRYTDATMSWSSTVELARTDGCTDVLSLSNSAFDSKEPSSGMKSATFVIGRFGDRYLDKNSPELPKLYQGPSLGEWVFHPLDSLARRICDAIVGDTGWYWDVNKYSDVLKRKTESEKLFRNQVFVEDGVNVERVYPPDIPELPELLTMDRKRLLAGVRAGSLAVKNTILSLGHKNPVESVPAPETQTA